MESKMFYDAKIAEQKGPERAFFAFSSIFVVYSQSAGLE